MADEEKDKDKPKDDPIPDLGKLVENAIAKHGDNTSALKAIISDLYAARDTIKALKAKLPPEGARVISGDDLKHYEQYTALGTPSELRKAKEEREALATEAATLRRDGELRSIAERTGVRHAVLKTLAGSLVFGEAKQKDKAGKETAVITVKDGEAEAVPFDDYAAAHWQDFLPALKPGTTTTPEPKPKGTPSRLDNRTSADSKADVEKPLSIKQQMLRAGLGAF